VNSAAVHRRGRSRRSPRAGRQRRPAGGHRFSAFSISAINQRLDAGLAQFAGRKLEEAYPHLILDARYERVREAG
jgi:transposase-like protein